MSSDAARRVLTRAVGQPLDAEGAMLVAAAAVLAGEVPEVRDPGLAFVLAAATGRVESLAELGERVPEQQRALALSLAEPFLARGHRAEGRALVGSLLGDAAAKEAAIGLQLDPPPPYPDAYGRVLAAERAAREGRAADPATATTAAEASAALVALARADATRAPAAADALLEIYPPERIAPALRLAAAELVRAGLGAEVAKRALADGFVSEQATWAAAAAASGALDGPATEALAGELAPRVEDELDPGRELVAGLPLIEALGHADRAEAVLDLSVRLRVPPPLLASRLLFAEAPAAAAALAGHPGLERLFPLDEWDGLYRYDFGWWTVAGGDPSAVRDALTIAGAAPWSPLPGSLADVLRSV